MAKQSVKRRFAGFWVNGIRHAGTDAADRFFYAAVILFAVIGFDTVTGLYV